jgi:hypothetical protein
MRFQEAPLMLMRIAVAEPACRGVHPDRDLRRMT